jgi:hypothetical protein
MCNTFFVAVNCNGTISKVTIAISCFVWFVRNFNYTIYTVLLLPANFSRDSIALGVFTIPFRRRVFQVRSVP